MNAPISVRIHAANSSNCVMRLLSELGQTWLSRGVTTRLGEEIHLTEEDKQANEQALEEDERILSAYKFEDGRKMYIITECDRSYTTVLLPEEY